MTTAYLYTTAVPVLLGGKTAAGRLAGEIYTRHGITPHWFGKGTDLGLLTYAARHPLPAPVADMSDPLLVQILLDFARENPGLLILYPCAPEAVAFTERMSAALECCYVVTRPPEGDPLQVLVRRA